MSFISALFREPDVDELLARRDIAGLVNALKYKNARIGAGFALEKFIGRDAVEPLIIALRSGKHEVRAEAARILGRLRDPRAVEPLTGTVRDAHYDVRLNGIEALGWIEDQRALESLVGALRDRERLVREKAISSLADLKDERAIDPLLRIVDDESDETDIRVRAVHALGRLENICATSPLVRVLKSGELAMRKAAATALGRILDPRALETLGAATHDRSPEVREAAAEALLKIQKACAEGRARRAAPVTSTTILVADYVAGLRAGEYFVITVDAPAVALPQAQSILNQSNCQRFPWRIFDVNPDRAILVIGEIDDLSGSSIRVAVERTPGALIDESRRKGAG